MLDLRVGAAMQGRPVDRIARGKWASAALVWLLAAWGGEAFTSANEPPDGGGGGATGGAGGNTGTGGGMGTGGGVGTGGAGTGGSSTGGGTGTGGQAGAGGAVTVDAGGMCPPTQPNPGQTCSPEGL